MEKLQGPINPCFLGNHLDADYFEQEFITNEAFSFAEEEDEGPNFDTTTTSSLEDKMPFLQMLQGVETPSLFPSKEPSFQTLLRIQHLRKPWDMLSPYIPAEMETQIQALEFESYVTKEILDLHSPVKSETRDLQNPQLQSLTSSVEGLNSESNHQEQHMQFQRAQPTNSVVKMTTRSQQQHTGRGKQTQFSKASPVTREKRKRKRTKPIKNKEEVESQRMTHIAVERNRRRQMNDHLNTLRSLMPLSYVHRGDQASIIGGAIDFVKELEQLLQSLEEQKRMRMGAATSRANAVEGCDSATSTTTTTTSTSSSSTDKAILSNGFSRSRSEMGNCCEEKMKAEINSDEADIEVVVIQNHVNLKIQCPKTPGRLLKAIVALEDLKLTFLHLNITSSESTVHYSFNLKIEEDSKLGSAEAIAAAVHQICSYVNSS